MRLTQVWKVWAGVLPTEEVYGTEEAAREACAEALKSNPLAFFRAKPQWALQDADGRFVLLPEECEVVELGEVIV